MASTYTDELRLELQETGANDSTWGTKLNTVISLLEDSISGMATVAVTGGAYSLTTQNSAADEARVAILKFTGTLTSNATITIPDKTKTYVVWNATSGAYTLTLKPSSTGAAVTQGSRALVICDGTVAYKIIETTDLGAASATSLAVTAGLLDISGASSGQVKFPAAQNASSNANTLDDYEEGTWTPAVTLGGAAVGLTYSTQVGFYTKIGNLVAVEGYLIISAKGSSTGALRLTGLPFAYSNWTGGAALRTRDISYSGMITASTSSPATTVAITQTVAANGAETSLTDANLGADVLIAINFTYRT